MFFSMRSSKTHSKRKRKKRKRFQRGWMSGCKLFDLKIFLLKGRNEKMKEMISGKILSETRRA
jgi:hypothetical protein